MFKRQRHVVGPVSMLQRTARRVARKLLAAGITTLSVLTVAPQVDAFTAAAGMTGVGNPQLVPAPGGQFTTLDIQTFAGINNNAAAQLATTQNLPNLNGKTIKLVAGTFTVGGNTFGADIWSTWDAAAGVTAIPKPAMGTGMLAGNVNCTANGGFSLIAGLTARASVFGPAGGARRAGAQVIDPFRVPVGTYSMDPIIGGMNSYAIDDINNTALLPTSLKVDQYGETGSIVFFADDSNDATLHTTRANPIWSFGIHLDATKSTPTLSSTFTYDPTRLSFSGSPPTASSLLNELLADTANVSLTNSGVLGMELTINNPVTLFHATYTAASPSLPYVDFSFGPMAGAVRNLAGDFNGNGSVDAADYVVWRKGLGTNYTPNDYNLWRANFGQTAGSGAGAVENTAVPEPATLIIFIVGIVAIGSRRGAAAP